MLIDHHFADRSRLSTARTMPVPFTGAIAAACTAPMPAGVQLESRWSRDATGPFGRSDLAPARAQGTLVVGRRTVAAEFELAPWSDQVTELTIRPAVRAPHRWSARRRRRGYSAAHAAADALRQRLVLAQPAPRRRPRTRAPAAHRLAG